MWGDGALILVKCDENLPQRNGLYYYNNFNEITLEAEVSCDAVEILASGSVRRQARRFGCELLVLRFGWQLMIGLGVVDDAREELQAERGQCALP